MKNEIAPFKLRCVTKKADMIPMPAGAAKRVGGPHSGIAAFHHPKSKIQNFLTPVLQILQLIRFRSPYGLLPAVFVRSAPILSKNAF